MSILNTSNFSWGSSGHCTSRPNALLRSIDEVGQWTNVLYIQVHTVHIIYYTGMQIKCAKLFSVYVYWCEIYMYCSHMIKLYTSEYPMSFVIGLWRFVVFLIFFSCFFCYAHVCFMYKFTCIHCLSGYNGV